MQDLLSFLQKYQDKCPKCNHKLHTGLYDISQGSTSANIEDFQFLVIKYKSSSYSIDELIIKINLSDYTIDFPNIEKYAATMKLLSSIRVGLFCYDCHFENNRSTPGFNIIYDLKIKDNQSAKMNLNFYNFCFVRNDITYIVNGDFNKNYQTVCKKKSNEGLTYTASSAFIPFEVWNFSDLDHICKKFDTIFLLM